MIGIFDSGLGGIGIFKEIKKRLPHEDLLYYADNKHVPYGAKSKQEIQKLTLSALKRMEAFGCSMIVIACNTATTSGIDYYRQKIKLPLVGVVPVIKTAAALTKNKKIALLATPLTNKNIYIDQLIEKFAADCHINKIACPDWVMAVENQNINNALLNKYLRKITDEDVIVLGCTHFPLIKNRIQKQIGKKIIIIDSNSAVSRHVRRVAKTCGLLNRKNKPAKYFLACSGELTQLAHQFHKFFPALKFINLRKPSKARRK